MKHKRKGGAVRSAAQSASHSALRGGFLLLASKRLIRTVYYPVMLLVFAVCVVASAFVGGSEGLPDAGVYDADGSELSRAVVARLCENGFREFGGEDELRRSVGEGEIDCGTVIPHGFGEKLASGDTDSIVGFVYSPASFAPKLFQDHIIAAVYGEYAPFITADALSGTEIAAGEVVSAYRDREAAGPLFSFAIEESEDVPRTASGSDRSLTYVVFTASVLLFGIIMYSSAVIFDGDGALTARLGARADLLSVKLPGITARVIFCVGASALACAALALLGKRASAALFLPLTVYILLLTSFGTAASCVLVKRGRVQALSFFMILASLLLCPLYFDAASIIPAAGFVRLFLPTYWLRLAVENTAATAVAAAASVPVTALLLVYRERRNLIRI